MVYTVIMSEDTKSITLRVPAVWAERLDAAHWEEHLSVTELLLQGMVIRLMMPNKDRLPEVLERYGYQARRGPGRPRKVPAGANGQGPPGMLPGPADAPDDGWDLDGDASDA
jgi:hypothetical protein